MTRRGSGIALAASVIVLLLLCTPALVGQSAAQEPTDQERFELVHRSLTSLKQAYSDDVLKIIAFLLLAIGWILTSDRSREFLKNNRAARRAALSTVPALALLHVVWNYEIYGAFRDKMESLKGLYFDAEYYADDGITGLLFTTNLVVHLALFLTLFALIYSLSRAKS